MGSNASLCSGKMTLGFLGKSSVYVRGEAADLRTVSFKEISPDHYDFHLGAN